MRGYDAWVTREPPEPPEAVEHRCSCGAFLSEQAVRKITQQSYEWCDGKPKSFEDEHEEGVLAIIGEEHRGEKFTRAFPPPCGGKDVDSIGGYVEEISPSEIPEFEHEGHWFVDPYGWMTTLIRVCRVCGAKNEEIIT